MKFRVEGVVHALFVFDGPDGGERVPQHCVMARTVEPALVAGGRLHAEDGVPRDVADRGERGDQTSRIVEGGEPSTLPSLDNVAIVQTVEGQHHTPRQCFRWNRSPERGTGG
jgi:hypothetical protein